MHPPWYMRHPDERPKGMKWTMEQERLAREAALDEQRLALAREAALEEERLAREEEERRRAAAAARVVREREQLRLQLREQRAQAAVAAPPAEEEESTPAPPRKAIRPFQRQNADVGSSLQRQNQVERFSSHSSDQDSRATLSAEGEAFPTPAEEPQDPTVVVQAAPVPDEQPAAQPAPDEVVDAQPAPDEQPAASPPAVLHEFSSHSSDEFTPSEVLSESEVHASGERRSAVTFKGTGKKGKGKKGKDSSSDEFTETDQENVQPSSELPAGVASAAPAPVEASAAPAQASATRPDQSQPPQASNATTTESPPPAGASAATDASGAAQAQGSEGILPTQNPDVPTTQAGGGDAARSDDVPVQPPRHFRYYDELNSAVSSSSSSAWVQYAGRGRASGERGARTASGERVVPVGVASGGSEDGVIDELDDAVAVPPASSHGAVGAAVRSASSRWPSFLERPTRSSDERGRQRQAQPGAQPPPNQASSSSPKKSSRWFPKFFRDGSHNAERPPENDASRSSSTPEDQEDNHPPPKNPFFRDGAHAAEQLRPSEMRPELPNTEPSSNVRKDPCFVDEPLGDMVLRSAYILNMILHKLVFAEDIYQEAEKEAIFAILVDTMELQRELCPQDIFHRVDDFRLDVFEATHMEEFDGGNPYAMDAMWYGCKHV